MTRLKKIFLFLPICTFSPFHTFALEREPTQMDLIAVYQLARQQDPVVLQAQAQRDAAFENIGVARANLLPHIDLSGQANYQRSSDDNQQGRTITSLGVNLVQNVFNKGYLQTLDLKEKQAALANLQYQQALQELLIRVTRAYFNVLDAQDKLTFTQANAQALERQRKQMQQRYDVGLTAITDVQEATASHHQALADVIAAQNSVRNQIEELRQLTGSHPLKELAPLDTEYFSTPGTPIPLTRWEETAQESNKSLLISRLSQAISKVEIESARSGYYPSVSLNAQATSEHVRLHETDSSASQTPGRTNTGQIGLTLSVPLFSGGETSASVRAAQAQFVSASEALEQLKRQVMRDIRSFFNNVSANKSSVDAYKKLVLSAQTAFEATEAGYKVGTRTTVDVLDATQKVFSAQSSLAGQRYNYIVNILQLKYTAGVLNEDDLRAVNNGLRTKL